jgi:hypothetical protein
MITKGEFKQSTFADTHEVRKAIGAQSLTSLCRVATEDEAARSFRVTLGRVQRRDRQAIMNSQLPDLPAFRVPDFAYLAASRLPIPPPVVPPRRSNPIWSTLAPDASHIISPIFVQIEWGMSSGSRYRLLANWPMTGGSIVVQGSQVEVFGGVIMEQDGPPPIDEGAMPVLAASLIPDQGPVVSDNDLSLQQNVLIVDQVNGPATAAGLATNGVTVPASGFLVGGVSPPQAALPKSAVYGVGPFTGWTARIVPQGGAFGQGGTPRQLVIEAANQRAPQQLELRDHQIPDGLGGWVSSPGNVGVIYSAGPGAPGPITVAQLEALIDTSALVRVADADPDPGFELTDQWTDLALFTPVAAGVGVGAVVGATAGGHVYVPDFARRVNVSCALANEAFIGDNPRIPPDGPLTAQLVWYDDQGFVVFSEIQGVMVDGGTGVPVLEPQVWRPVPAQAVMLGIYATLSGVAIGATVLGQVHWRISP